MALEGFFLGFDLFSDDFFFLCLRKQLFVWRFVEGILTTLLGFLCEPISGFFFSDLIGEVCSTFRKVFLGLGLTLGSDFI